MALNKPKPAISTLLLGKVPPQAIELEAAVLAACMLERETFDTVMPIIHSPECFYIEAHQKVYEAMLSLNNKHTPIDLLTISEELRKLNTIEIVGGPYELTQLSRSVTSTAHVEAHARIVIEKFNARELIRICGNAISQAYDESIDIFDLTEDTERSVRSISEGLSSESSTPVGETYEDILMEIEERKINPTPIAGIDTGYAEINEVTNGWQKSELIILAARPSQGKTAFALNLAMNAALSTTSPCNVLVFSLEASKSALVKRLAAAKNEVALTDIRKGILTDYQESKMMQGLPVFRNMKFRIDDKSQNLMKIIGAIRREKKKRPDLQLIIIDYLQLIRGIKDKNSNREQEVANITRELKLLATELEIAIIALSQLNRETMKQAGGKPGLHNLRESGAIEQDANIVMFIWHEEIGTDPQGNEEIKTWILIEKNRDGKCGPVELYFAKDIQAWVSMSKREDQQAFAPKPNAGFQQAMPDIKNFNWDD